ncbi:hypothetical protein OS493_029921 [Desmophyllum pertusum]|uniref:Uncharacterized protein n=1 Tax=Desmophyllum pertusum TaxID=174260 RepID=A0A9X0CCT9_9CNID|nr:hypothetical protein OS493_029921 [Desmophyllum pertusum]
MFKKLKQKLAEETEGEQSPRRQSPRESPRGPERNGSATETPSNPEGDRGSPLSTPRGNVTNSPLATPNTSQTKAKSTPREVLDRVYNLLDTKLNTVNSLKSLAYFIPISFPESLLPLVDYQLEVDKDDPNESQPGQSDSRNGEKPPSGETTPPKSTSTPSKSSSQDSVASDTETPKRAVERQGSIPPSSPGGKSDAESDAEQGGPGTPMTPTRLEGASKEEMVAMFRKQERVLTRYKTRFSEVHCNCLTVEKDVNESVNIHRHT